jgi:hypothetical protein
MTRLIHGSHSVEQRLETANVGRTWATPVAGLEYAIRKGAFNLMRCPVPYAPASAAELGTRRLDSSASSLMAAQSRLTFTRLSLAAVLTFTRAPNVLSGRSSDVAWGGLYGQRLMGSEPPSQSSSFSARSLRHVHAAGHRVSNASAPPERLRRASTRVCESRTRKWAPAHDRSMRTAQ